MCKLFAILDIEDQKAAEKYALAAIPFVTALDNHGLGIMRLGENGVCARRWLDVPTLHTEHPFNQHLDRYRDALSPRYQEQGVPSRQLHALAIHGRFATCKRSLENTHPFYEPGSGSALMHNGVISNPAAFTVGKDGTDRAMSSCDSEALLWSYIDNEVEVKPGNLTAAMDDLRGYYACIVFNDSGVVDIWRDQSATLFLGYVQGVGTVVATSHEIIAKTAKRIRKKLLDVDEVNPFTHIRWTKEKGPVISTFSKPIIATVGSGYSNPMGYGHGDEDWWKREGAEDPADTLIECSRPDGSKYYMTRGGDRA